MLQELHLLGRWMDVSHTVDQSFRLISDLLRDERVPVASHRDAERTREVQEDVPVHVSYVGPTGRVPENGEGWCQVGHVS
jgi:hypothetical protein